MALKIGLESLGVYLFCAVLCGFFQFLTPYLPETDGYFHIKLAWLLRRDGLFLEGFPWAYFSLWRENFSDGALMFHVFLIPFTYGDLAFGAKLASVLLAAGVLTSFFAIVSLNGVRWRFYWLWLLMLGGGFFWWRIMVPRPQGLSVMLLLWSTHFLLNGRARAFAAVSFLYPLSYVAAFLPQIFAVVRWGYHKMAEGRSEHKILLAGLVAYGAGMLLHPYFPKNILFFYVQNIYVMCIAWTGQVELFLGGEIFPMDTREMLGAHAVLLAHLAALFFFLMHRPSALSIRTKELFLIALLAGLMTCGSKRFTEYSVPLAALFCAFLAHDLLEKVSENDLIRAWPRAGRWVIGAWLILMGCASGSMAYWLHGEFTGIKPSRFEGLARVLMEKVPPGRNVFVCDWDEPPELLFFDHDHRYPVLMDPTFMYYWDKGIWKRWFDVANGKLSADDTALALTEIFESRHGLCGSRFKDLRRLVGGDKRFRVLHEDEGGYLFELINEAAPKSSL